MSISVSFNLTITTTNPKLVRLLARVPEDGFFKVLYNEKEQLSYNERDYERHYDKATLKVSFDLPLSSSNFDLNTILNYDDTTIEGTLSSDDGYNAIFEDGEWVSNESDYDEDYDEDEDDEDYDEDEEKKEWRRRYLGLSPEEEEEEWRRKREKEEEEEEWERLEREDEEAWKRLCEEDDEDDEDF